MVEITDEKTGKTRTVHFGGVKNDGTWYEDFTYHKDLRRMERYDGRHQEKENWGKSGIHTAGFWSKWLLWSEESLNEAIEYISDEFNVKITKYPRNLVTEAKEKYK